MEEVTLEQFKKEGEKSCILIMRFINREQIPLGVAIAAMGKLILSSFIASGFTLNEINNYLDKLKMDAEIYFSKKEGENE
jgi:hypothetical protein